METKKLKIKVTERQSADGRKFKTFKTFSKNGRATEVKFRKEIKDIPEKDCYINVNVDDMNLNTAGEYPILWVKAIVSIEDNAEVNADKNREKINEYFG